MRARLRIDSRNWKRYCALPGQVWSGVGRPSGPHDRIVNGPAGMAPESLGLVPTLSGCEYPTAREGDFPSRLCRILVGRPRDTTGTPVPQTSRRASLAVERPPMPETGALLWVLAGRSDTSAIAAQQCTIATNRQPEGKSSTCISRCRMRFGTILDALRDQPPGSEMSRFFKGGAAIRATPTSPVKTRVQRHVHSHSRFPGSPWRTACTRVRGAEARASDRSCRYLRMDSQRTLSLSAAVARRPA
jgi:hypothetical protein